MTPRRGTTLRHTRSLDAEPDPRSILDQHTLPAKRGGRADAAAELDVILGAKKEQFGTAPGGVLADGLRTAAMGEEVERH
jgi:hypothetical protein